MLRNRGRYDEAATHLREVLEQYPRDRVVHDDLGRIYFLQRLYPEAVKEFNATLAIDPEDLEANYNLMLCNTGLGGQMSRANTRSVICDLNPTSRPRRLPDRTYAHISKTIWSAN